jgi:protein-S-isoprenylcysteine O-methyltransferase Ste14
MAANRLADDQAGLETPGIIVRPILLVPVALLLGFSLDHLAPAPLRIAGTGMAHWGSAAVAGALILIGVAIFAAGVGSFRRAATPLPTNQPARVLVTTGVYGWTRNPLYLAFLLVFAGVGLAVRSPWILVLALPVALTIRYAVVAREEAYLQRRFSDAYLAYKRRVRRWL